MESIGRRKLMQGSAALAVAAAVPVAVVVTRSNAAERIEYHMKELERAVGEHYGCKTDVTYWPGSPGLNAHILVVGYALPPRRAAS